ncbi:MAG: FAD-dependent oxidoreductase [Vicinamibacterales bacterium]
MSADVIVIGGGVAGFSAATALVEAGARVLVLEARPGLGGRAAAFTDPETGERVDNGQHILMGCYTDTLRLLQRIGASDRVRWQAGLALTMIDQRGRESVLKLPPMPSPLHLLGGVLAWDALDWSERLSILRVGAALGPANHLRQGYGGQEAGHHIGTTSMWRPPLGGPQSVETVREWLTHYGQAPRLCELFWEPLALAALNQSIDQAAASYFVGVLAQMFGPDPAAASLVMPAVPLDELYAEPARAWLEQRGSEVRVNAPARVLIDGDRVTGVRVRDEHISAPVVISTVPWHGLAALFEQPPPALAATIADASATASLPIVTVNLWFDRPVMLEPLIGLPGRAFQWVFDRRAIVGGSGSHLSMISSGAESIVAMTNEALIALALADVRAALPPARAAVFRKGLAVREKRSTFSLAPDAPPRPRTETAITGFVLAGDWVDTGLPATIESAAVSGHRAAAFVLTAKDTKPGTTKCPSWLRV